MNFNDLVKERCEKIVSVLASKEKEYAAGEDRFHNFNVAGRISDCSPEKALKGMWMKHIVSVFDLIDWADSDPEKLTSDLIDEKIGDSVNYLILLEGMLKDRVVEPVEKCCETCKWCCVRCNVYTGAVECLSEPDVYSEWEAKDE
jgi:hypothetical protein